MGVYSNYVNDNYKVPLDIPLNEAYFGISKDLEKIIKVLGEYRSKYMVPNNKIINAYSYDSMSLSKCNTDKKLYEFNRLMENFFGFKSFSLCVSTTHLTNAYTIPYTTRANRIFKTEKDLVKTKNGIAYNKDISASCVVYIYGAVIFNPDYTDKEILAIIFHEVGHNFSYYQDPFIQLDSLLMHLLKPLCIVIDIMVAISNGEMPDIAIFAMYSGEKTWELYKKVRDVILSNPVSGFIIDVGNAYKNLMLHNINILRDIKSYLPIDPEYLFKYILKSIMNMSVISYVAGYRNEKLSDNFATMYGLGPDLSSALNKMETNYTISGPSGIMSKLNKVPVLKWYKDIIYIPVDFLLGLINEHPMSPARFESQIRYLKAELDKEDIDPKVKKDILDQINYMDTEIKKQYTAINKATDPKLVYKLYSAFLLEIFGGDPRNVFDKNGRYNKKYDKVLNNLKMI